MTLPCGRLFAGLPTLEPPAYLYTAILARIAQAEVRALRRRILLFIPASCAALAAAVGSSLWTAAALKQSAFAQYAAFAFTDTALVAANWREFALSLLESVPALALIAVLASLFAALMLLRLAMPLRRGSLPRAGFAEHYSFTA